MKVSVHDHVTYVDKKPAPFRASPNRGGALRAKICVLHDTASRLALKGPVAWMTNPQARVSAHVCVGREGHIVQLVPFNLQAWHAGRSAWRGQKWVNGFGIGIEIVNPGKMTKGTGNTARAWWGEEFDIDQWGIKLLSDPDHGAGYWMPYTSPQIEAVACLVDALVDAYKLVDVTTHYAISPGRKVDVNPLFPIEVIRRRALGPNAAMMGRA